MSLLVTTAFDLSAKNVFLNFWDMKLSTNQMSIFFNCILWYLTTFSNNLGNNAVILSTLIESANNVVISNLIEFPEACLTLRDLNSRIYKRSVSNPHTSTMYN